MAKASKTKRRRSEAAARCSQQEWQEGTVQEFLGLTPEVAELIRTKAALAVFLQRSRREREWSQEALAQEIGSGQSRVAKMEAAHPSVSLDLLIKALLITGVTMPHIAAVMATGDPDAKSMIRKSRKPVAKRSRGKVRSMK